MIQTLAEQIVTAVALNKPVILSQWRRICAQVKKRQDFAGSFVFP